MNEGIDYVEFCKYVQPIVNGCSGFIKTVGFFVHIPGVLMLMSDDESFVSIINIPVIFNCTLYGYINSLLGCKEEEQQRNLPENIYYTGSNIKANKLIDYYSRYKTIENVSQLLYSELDCNNIPGFTEMVGKTDFSTINVTDGTNVFRIPVSKTITPINKGDSVSIKIFRDILYPDIGVVKYITYKKKYKLPIELYFNIKIL